MPSNYVSKRFSKLLDFSDSRPQLVTQLNFALENVDSLDASQLPNNARTSRSYSSPVSIGQIAVTIVSQTCMRKKEYYQPSRPPLESMVLTHSRTEPPQRQTPANKPAIKRLNFKCTFVWGGAYKRSKDYHAINTHTKLPHNYN